MRQVQRLKGRILFNDRYWWLLLITSTGLWLRLSSRVSRGSFSVGPRCRHDGLMIISILMTRGVGGLPIDRRSSTRVRSGIAPGKVPVIVVVVMVVLRG